MNAIKVIAMRELRAYFSTPLAYVFLVIYLVLMGFFTFGIGGFYDRGQADLEPFFGFHPWLYLILVPAISMAALGGGTEVRQHRTLDDAADHYGAGGSRQVPGGVGLYRTGAGADVSDVADRQTTSAIPTTASSSRHTSAAC